MVTDNATSVLVLVFIIALVFDIFALYIEEGKV